jgi:hypothetical protein
MSRSASDAHGCKAVLRNYAYLYTDPKTDEKDTDGHWTMRRERAAAKRGSEVSVRSFLRASGTENLSAGYKQRDAMRSLVVLHKPLDTCVQCFLERCELPLAKATEELRIASRLPELSIRFCRVKLERFSQNSFSSIGISCLVVSFKPNSLDNGVCDLFDANFFILTRAQDDGFNVIVFSKGPDQ